jgi:hypothetical protein
MTHWLRRCAVLFPLAAVFALTLSMGQDHSQEPTRLPNGKLQRDEILKAEHEQNVKDAAQLVELAQQLQQDVEKNDRFVLSISTLKKTDDIEKLVKKIRSRMRR